MLTLLEFALVLTFRKPLLINSNLHLNKKSLAPKIIFSIFIVVFLFLLFFLLKELSTPHPLN